MPKVLGISCFFHDSSAAIISDNGILCAAEEERFSRIKHDSRFPINSIKFCLDYAKINSNEIDALVFYENPVKKFDRIINRFLKNFPRSLNILKDIINEWHSEKLWIKEIASKTLNIKKNKIFFSNHHNSHGASAYYTSNFDDAVIYSADGVGEWESVVGSLIDKKQKKNLIKVNFPNSLGILYSALTEFLGFEVNEGEYKVMGMAAYGEPIYQEKIEKLFKFRSSENFELDLSYFAFEYNNKTNLTSKFIELFGEKRIPESKFFKYDEKSVGEFSLESNQKYYADLAASLQVVIESQIVDMVKYLQSSTSCKNLCYAGGLAYNSVANKKIMQTSGFENINIQPAAGDNGAAIGCALQYWNDHIKKIEPSDFIQKDTYLGKNYSDQDILDALANFNFSFEKFNADNLENFVAENISNEKIFAISRGRFEFGPRALGNRSIIADPRSISMKKKINQSIKYREIFRPFAPVVIKEYASKYFNLDEIKTNLQPYENMLAVAEVRDDVIDKLECVTHVDKSARVQILSYERNNFLYNVIKNFGDLTGIYCLVNTSFNLRGEPMVASPLDALKTFSWSKLDFLVIENFVVSKK